MRVVVCDTGPILHLHEAGLLDWLRSLGDVHIPSAVEMELGRLVAEWHSRHPDWLVIDPIPDSVDERVSAMCSEMGLGPGETEAIALALHVKPDWLLTDDALARTVSEMLGLDAHGSLGVVLWRAAQGELTYPEATEGLRRLSQTSLWLSQQILDEAEAALRTIFSPA